MLLADPMTRPRIAPCLWFDGNALEAAQFYAASLPNSRIDHVHKSPADYPAGKAGDVLTVEFTLLGSPFVGLNGGPMFRFNEAVSFQVYTETQEETDRYWEVLTKNGGQPGQCGWCKDRFGLSWQIVPRQLLQAITGADAAGAKQGMMALMDMTKIDIAAIEQAAKA